MTLGQQGAWWPLLGTCEVEKFGIPRRQAWGTGHCVRLAANGKAGENDDQGLQVEGESQFGEGVGGILEIWHASKRSLCTVPVFSSIFHIACNRSRAHSPIPHFNGWNGRQKIVRIRGG